jgi:hypothetical protein
VAITLAWRPFLTVVFGAGRDAVRRIEALPEGAWRLIDGAGRAHPAELSAASATLGPWLLLLFETRGQGRRQALIDAASTDATAFRALKGRLNC